MPNQAPVAVTGKVFAKWKEKGLTKGLLGFPLADMRRVPPSGAQGFNTTGLTQQFEGGQVFLPTSGPRNGLAVAVLGERLLKAYEQTGGTSGWLGFPVGELSEGRDINELLLAFHDPLEFIEFEGGLLVRWDRKNPAENWRAYCNRYLEGKYIIEGQTKKEMNYGGSSRVGWTGWFSRAEDFGVKGIFLLDSALAMDDTITINVSVTFEKVKGFFPNETTALIRGVLVEHYGWKDVTHHQPITVAGLFAATPLVALKMNVPYSGSITFPLPKKCGLLRFYVPWPNGYLVGPMTFALSSQESEKLMMAQDYLKKPYENDTTVYSKILDELPYEYEGDIKQVKRDRLKFEEFVNKYPTSKYAPEALYNIVFLYYYPVQCEIDEDFAKECVIGVKKTYSILLQQFPSSEWTHKAKAYFEMAQEYASKRFEEKETEKVPRHVPMDELKEKQRNAMKDITDISTAIADYIADNKVAPEQAGIYDINNRFYASLSPFYIKVLPIKDPWGNNYRVYCGKACNGKYGLTNPGVDDFVVCSYGLDGKEEAWEFDPHNPEAGLFIAKELSDLNKDLVMWNGSWVRGPRTAETVR